MNTTAAVTPDKSDIQLMKALWAEGLSFAAIADKFELPVEVVCEVCRGRKAKPREKRPAKVKHRGPSNNAADPTGPPAGRAEAYCQVNWFHGDFTDRDAS